jgi:hypothetical protein
MCSLIEHTEEGSLLGIVDSEQRCVQWQCDVLFRSKTRPYHSDFSQYMYTLVFNLKEAIQDAYPHYSTAVPSPQRILTISLNKHAAGLPVGPCGRAHAVESRCFYTFNHFEICPSTCIGSAYVLWTTYPCVISSICASVRLRWLYWLNPPKIPAVLNFY